MQSILSKLEGGDCRSIGRSNEVVRDVLTDPVLFDAVFAGMLVDNPLVRMRAADAIEKITVRHPEYLRPHRKVLIDRIAWIDQKEVRWHVAQMLPRVEWNETERRQVVSIILQYLNDRSSIVKTFAMQALANLAAHAPEWRPVALTHLRELTATGTPAMKARGRKLLAEMSARADHLPRTHRIG